MGTDKVFDSIGFNLRRHLLNVIDKNKNLVDIVYTIEKVTKDGKDLSAVKIKRYANKRKV
jgi:hypothetical protein